MGSGVLVAAFPMLVQGGYANIDPVSRQAILAAVEGEASLVPNSPPPTGRHRPALPP